MADSITTNKSMYDIYATAQQQRAGYNQMMRLVQAGIGIESLDDATMLRTTTGQDTAKQFNLLKKSLKQIRAEPFGGDVRVRIEKKINRLENAGATKQALILEAEIRTRESLVRLQEWDYKVLPKAAIDKFQKENTMTFTRDGLKLHVDQLEAYVGNPKSGEAKDRILPDDVLEKLEEAKERELFDSFAVLWAEKVKDPIVLGCVDGCEDYFFIAEWSDDITFEQITKGE